MRFALNRMVRTLAMAAGLAVVTSGCATTSFTSSWKAPDAERLNARAGAKVVAFYLSEPESARRAAEDALAARITADGGLGIAGYSLVPTAVVLDEAAVKAKLEQAGVAAIVVLRPVDTSKEVYSTPPTVWSRPVYRPVWGGYWAYGWRTRYVPGTIQTNTVVTVETLVYSMAQNRLIWAGVSKTTNPEKLDTFVNDVLTAVSAEMKKSGLL